MTIRRLLSVGLLAMGFIALASVIWPAVATAVSITLGVAIVLVFAAPVVLVVRWIRGELACRCELRTMPPASAYGGEAADPTVAQLRESA